MTEAAHQRKHVVVHVGPHKTGSTAIQRALKDNRAALLGLGIEFVHNTATHDAAMKLVREDFDAAEIDLKQIASDITSIEVPTAILSQEDFCGDLPGRSRRRTIYPKLLKNLRVISRALSPHRVTFVFFERDEERWLQSCYFQHLKHRTQYSDFTTFRAHFGESISWAEKLEKPQELFRDRFVSVPYERSPEAGFNALLGIAGCADSSHLYPPSESNTSPEPAKLRLLERINALSAFKETAWFAKSLAMQDWKPKPPSEATSVSSSFSELAQLAFPALVGRASHRIQTQKIDDILPPEDIDLSRLADELLPVDVELPTMSRADIRDQSVILDYHLRGKSRLAKLNALTISYLRRRSEHTHRARYLFHRIWREQGAILVNELTTRWLISTLQTFLDHGANEEQRLIGAGGYFYANVLKIYEGERSIEGHQQDALYEHTCPQTANKFSGLDRYSVGGTDLLLNTNAMLLDLAMRDDVAGLVLIELLLRVKSSDNVFTRMDRARAEHGIAVPGFEDTWAFFEAYSKGYAKNYGRS